MSKEETMEIKKVIIAGYRDFNDFNFLEEKLNEILTNNNNIEIVSGTARGVDQMGERYALKNNIPVKRFPANWDKYGKRAGYLRNDEMAKYADALIAFWNGTSRGTGHMIDLAKRNGLEVTVIKC